MARPALEAALRERPHDEQAWSVLGDLLTAEGDARGELIALEQRAASCERPFERAVLLHQATELFEREHRRWLGPLADAGLEISWQRGYATEVVIARNHPSTLSKLLELPIAALLRKLTFVGARKLSSLSERLVGVPISTLELRGRVDASLAPLRSLVQLRELIVEGGTNEGVDALAALPELHELALRRCDGPLTGFEAGFERLRNLDLSARAHARELGVLGLAPLARLTGLERLILHDGGWFELDPLAELRALTWLDLRSTDIHTLAPLAELSQLRCLLVSGCTELTRLDALARLHALTRVELAYTRVRSLDALAGLRALESIDLTGTPVRSVAPLFGLPALRRVGLGACEVDDLRPLVSRGVTLVGVRPPEPSWRELAEQALEQLSKR